MKTFCATFLILLSLLFDYCLSKDFENYSYECILKDQTIPQSIEPINFNFVRVGNSKFKNFSIENAGTTTYSINKIAFQNGGLGVFSVASNPKVPVNIQPNESIIIFLTFLPDRVGSFYDTLLVYFNEPFYFIYSVPVEGHSIAYNLIFGKDTSDFIGESNFKVPIFIKGDSNLIAPIPINLTLSLTTNSKVYFIDSISQVSVLSTAKNGPFQTFTIQINNFILDSSLKTLFYTVGRLFLSDQDTTMLTIGNAICDENGIYFELKPVRIEAYGICVSNLSLINFNWDYVEIKIPFEVISDKLVIIFQNENNIRSIANINVFNILGKLIFNTKIQTANAIELPLQSFSSGIYKVEVTINNQKYSKIISVIK